MIPWPARSAQPPWRILFNDDATDVPDTRSPYNRPGDAYGAAMIDAAVDEAVRAGITDYVIQPGTGWVPWWTSTVYPAAEHHRWFTQTFGEPPGNADRYVMDGGDPLADYVSSCAKRRIPLTVSLRLNDAHAILLSGLSPDEYKARRKDPKLPEWMRGSLRSVSRIHMEHPEWRRNPGAQDYADPKRLFEHLWDWGRPEPVAERLRLFGEVARNYRMAGLELDFMRFPFFFTDATPLPRRREIMTRFVAGMRAALDEGVNAGKRPELTVRLPGKMRAWPDLGLDAGALRGAGVSRFTISSHTFTSQDVDFGPIRAAGGGAALTLELGQGKSFRQVTSVPYADGVMKVDRADMLPVVALAAQHGFDSVSLFNFVYWRRYVNQSKAPSPADEPPWAWVRDLRPERAAAEPAQCWYLGTGYDMGMPGLELPAALQTGRSLALRIETVRPASGWQEGAKLRYVVSGAGRPDAPGAAYALRLNGEPLAPANDTGVPGVDQDPGLPYRACAVPIRALRDGANALDIAQTAGPPSRLFLVEIHTRTA